MSATSQKRRRSSQIMTSQLLWKLCRFPKPDFLQLKREMAVHMVDPKNRIGLEELGGEDFTTTEAQRKVWEKWLDGFIDGNISMRYWGPGTNRRWDLTTGRERIRTFMGEMVKYTNTILKNTTHSRIKTEESSPDTAPPGKRLRPVVAQTSADVVTIINLEAEPEKQEITRSAATAPQQQRDFVLESALSGSTGSIRLIYSTDVLSINHLVEQVRKKHCLDEEREILKICVKIRGRYLNVGLEDGRDWAYIARVIADSEETPELIVWTS